MSKSFRSIITLTISAFALLWTLNAVNAAPMSLGAPTIIAATTPDSQRPQIAYANAITHAVWVDAGWIIHSRNTGLSWTAPISVAIGDDPALTVDSSGMPHLAFTTLISSTLNVYHARYSANAWSAPLQVSEGLANTSAPDIAVAPDNSLSIVWSEGVSKQLHLARSTNGGQTWPDLAPIFAANGSAPEIAIGSDNVTHVVWQDDTAAPFRIKHTQRVTGTWSLIDVLSDEIASSFSPDVAASGNEAHLVWQQSSAILYTHGTNLNFAAPIALSTGTASAPTIAAMASTSLATAWDAGVTITLRLSTAGVWGNPLTLGVNAGGAGQPTLTAGPNGAVYGAFTWGAVGSRDIAFNAYTIDTSPNTPATPILIAPPNGVITTANSIELQWQSGGGAVTGYNVDVDGAVITTSNTTSITLLALGVHSWRVRAYNGSGYSAWAAPWTIEVSNTLPAPGTPILIAPANGAVTAANALDLMWQIGAGGTPAGYNVDVNGSIITTTNPVSAAVLSPGTYTWTVRAFNGTGYSAWAAPWSFKALQPRIFLPLVTR
jgi:hypothetical protein